jgi:hypothetical protein
MTALQLANGAAWVATAIGIGMWLWSWLREKDAIARLRLNDCGLVLVAAAIVLRIVAQERAMTVLDWAMAFLAPLFIAAALWRLTRTSGPRPGR